MNTKKVVIMALHSDLESAYPPLNISVGAVSSGATVVLAFARDGVDILNSNYIPIPSKGRGYLANALSDFGAPSIQELLSIASEMGVRFIIVDQDAVDTDWNVESKPIKWILNEAASADLFLHF
ncbi:peroxiredoxin family protein [Fodinisporobacter ferrooxydans]|uniref:Peroxiredoxin family protein n=1 Tax=Fodinisporobacter ferrooxydans TaxID=2901836 RepID=A0ABY4CNC1_9BACL|nr:peroxiredoxin family protein [Alicyclobacillaceae bacterium MYW30-H2]